MNVNLSRDCLQLDTNDLIRHQRSGNHQDALENTEILRNHRIETLSSQATIPKSNSSPSYRRESVKIRRLQRMYRFWEPLDSVIEIASQSSSRQTQDNHHTRMDFLLNHPESPLEHQATSSNFQSSNCLTVTNDRSTANPQATVIIEDADSVGRKLWQSLVMPIVIACVIFLIALWTRQLSLVLLNDTITMIFIFFGVFITMSGLAFWLAQDRKINESEGLEIRANNNDHQDNPTCSSDHAGCSLCLGNRKSKCCGLSVIDCHPPDYYVALRESKPIQFYNSSYNEVKSENQNHEDDKQYVDDDTSLILTIEASFLNPPSYDDLLINHQQR